MLVLKPEKMRVIKPAPLTFKCATEKECLAWAYAFLTASPHAELNKIVPHGLTFTATITFALTRLEFIPLMLAETPTPVFLQDGYGEKNVPKWPDFIKENSDEISKFYYGVFSEQEDMQDRFTIFVSVPTRSVSLNGVNGETDTCSPENPAGSITDKTVAALREKLFASAQEISSEGAVLPFNKN